MLTGSFANLFSQSLLGFSSLKQNSGESFWPLGFVLKLYKTLNTTCFHFDSSRVSLSWDPIVSRVCKPQEILHLNYILAMTSRSSVEQQRFYKCVQHCLHKSLVLFWQCSNASSAPLHTLLILLFILRWTSSQMASSLIDSGLCMTITEACIMMSPCSVISQASAEHDLGSCIHDTVFSTAT